MGLFGKKNKNKEKGVPFWRRNKQQAEEETVLEPEEQTAEMVDAEAEEDIAAAALNDLAAQEQDEIEKARLAAQEVVEESEQHQAAIALARQAALEAAGILKKEEKAEPEEETEPEEEAEPEKETEPEAEEPEEVEPVEEPEQEAETESETEPAEAVEPESEEAAEPETELTEESEPEAEIEPEDELQPEEAEPEKKKGFFAKIRDGLRKTKDAMVSRMQQVLGGFTKIDDDLFDELEETMITSDLGPETSVQICETLRKRVKERGVKDPQEIMGMIQEIIGEMLGEDQTLEYPTQPTIVMVIGVNGAGKTTTIGKLCHQLKGEGKKVLVAAADTFRAAAIDQLEVWTQRAGVDIVKHAEGSDPASVVYDAIDAAKARGCDVLICDTAGRRQQEESDAGAGEDQPHHRNQGRGLPSGNPAGTGRYHRTERGQSGTAVSGSGRHFRHCADQVGRYCQGRYHRIHSQRTGHSGEADRRGRKDRRSPAVPRTGFCPCPV